MGFNLFSKDHGNQGFSTLDVLSVVSSVAAVALISTPLIRRGLESENLLLAEKQMREMAAEISVRGEESPSRRLASLSPSGEDRGQIDPWGQPYQQMVLRNAYGQITHILVWSFGPNGRLDTSNLKPRENGGVMAVVFDGDDVGALTAVR